MTETEPDDPARWVTETIGAITDRLNRIESASSARQAALLAVIQRSRLVERASTNADRRSALAFYLLAVADLLRAVGSNELGLKPQHDLAFLLMGLDLGRAAPLFDVKRGRGKPSISFPEAFRRGDAAAAIDLFVRSGMTVNNAIDRVAREIHETPGALKEWRKEASGGNADRDPSTIRYRGILDAVKQEPAESKKRATEIVGALKSK